MIHAESRVRVGRPGSDHVSTCRRRIRTEATIVGRWCGRTLHGRTGGRFIDVSTGDRYMQKVGSGGRPRSDHVSTCRRRIHTEAAGMSSHPNHDTCRKSGSGRAAGIGPCFDLSTTHTYGSNHSRAVVRADFAWTDGGQCVDGRQIHAESRVGRPRSDVVGALYMFRA